MTQHLERTLNGTPPDCTCDDGELLWAALEGRTPDLCTVHDADTIAAEKVRSEQDEILRRDALTADAIERFRNGPETAPEPEPDLNEVIAAAFAEVFPTSTTTTETHVALNSPELTAGIASALGIPNPT